MDNQESLPFILWPTIPAGFCPPGTFDEKMNALFAGPLSGAVVDLPGGIPSSAEIAEINAKIVDLQNQINAISAPERRSAIVAVAAGDSTVNITFATIMPNANYDILITFIDDTGASTAASANWYLVSGSKSEAGMNIRFVNIPVDITTFEYSVVQR